MSEQHKPDPEFVEYLQNEVKNPHLSAMSVMQMERVFIDQRNKYEARLSAHRMAEEAWEKTMMEVIGEDGPACVADAIRKLQDQVRNSIAKCDGNHGGKPCRDSECWNLPQGNAVVMGQLSQFGETYSPAMLIEFANVEDFNAAREAGQCHFTVFGGEA